MWFVDLKILFADVVCSDLLWQTKTFQELAVVPHDWEGTAVPVLPEDLWCQLQDHFTCSWHQIRQCSTEDISPTTALVRKSTKALKIFVLNKIQGQNAWDFVFFHLRNWIGRDRWVWIKPMSERGYLSGWYQILHLHLHRTFPRNQLREWVDLRVRFFWKMSPFLSQFWSQKKMRKECLLLLIFCFAFGIILNF